MKVFGIILLLIISSLVVEGQVYEAVKRDGVYLYSDDYGNIYGLRIDSAIINNIDTILFNYNTIQRADVSTVCFTPFGATWIGKPIVKKPNGIYCFINRDNDSIIINTRANIFEKWLCYRYSDGKYIEAAVSKTDTMHFAGITDSVKTISLQLKDSTGANVSHSINGYSIKVSKYHGLVKAFSFYSFPDISYSLIIVGGPGLSGKSNLTYPMVYDYNIGDEFHSEFYSGYYNGSYFDATRKISILKVKDKFSALPDSIIYTYIRCRKDIRSQNEIQQIKYYHDTIAVTTYFNESDNQYFEHLPEESIFMDSSNSISNLSMSFTFNHRTKKNIPTAQGVIIYDISDSCWHEAIFDGCPYFESYIEGCGGPYYECSEGVNEYYNKLLYYKKGKEEWGTALNCSTLLNADVVMENIISCRIFPNPSTGKAVLIIDKSLNCDNILRIYDCMGNIVLRRNINTNRTDLSFKNLSKGIYFYVLTDNKGIISSDKILIE